METSSEEGPGVKIAVHGHRGARARFPENTIPAFQHALEAGADVLEMDLGVTRDGVLVVSHEPTISPALCKGPGLGDDPSKPGPLIHSLTLAQLKQYDCGSKKQPRFPNQRQVPGTKIPTLDEVFALVRSSKLPAAKRVEFNIETKIFPDHPEQTVGPEEFSRRVVESFRKSGFLSRIILQSFDPRTLVEARKLEPSLRTSMLFDEGAPGDLVAQTQKIGAEFISPYYLLVTPTLIHRAHDAGIQVVPWTVNDVPTWDRLIDLGVDGIITDDPEALIRHMSAQRES